MWCNCKWQHYYTDKHGSSKKKRTQFQEQGNVIDEHAKRIFVDSILYSDQMTVTLGLEYKLMMKVILKEWDICIISVKKKNLRKKSPKM